MKKTLFKATEKPLPLPQFMKELGKLARAGKWKVYKAAVKKRIKYFEDRGQNNKF